MRGYRGCERWVYSQPPSRGCHLLPAIVCLPLCRATAARSASVLRGKRGDRRWCQWQRTSLNLSSSVACHEVGKSLPARVSLHSESSHAHWMPPLHETGRHDQRAQWPGLRSVAESVPHARVSGVWAVGPSTRGRGWSRRPGAHASSSRWFCTPESQCRSRRRPRYRRRALRSRRTWTASASPSRHPPRSRVQAAWRDGTPLDEPSGGGEPAANAEQVFLQRPTTSH